jgi:hypothetical protein
LLAQLVGALVELAKVIDPRAWTKAAL